MKLVEEVLIYRFKDGKEKPVTQLSLNELKTALTFVTNRSDALVDQLEEVEDQLESVVKAKEKIAKRKLKLEANIEKFFNIWKALHHEGVEQGICKTLK